MFMITPSTPSYKFFKEPREYLAVSVTKNENGFALKFLYSLLDWSSRFLGIFMMNSFALLGTPNYDHVKKAKKHLISYP